MGLFRFTSIIALLSISNSFQNANQRIVKLGEAYFDSLATLVSLVFLMLVRTSLEVLWQERVESVIY